MTIHAVALLSLKADRYDKDDRGNRSAFAHMHFERFLPIPRKSLTGNCDIRNINLIISVGILADKLV
jgi:hypothetical protein